MATADQIKALIRSHYAEDRESFTTVALQLAAHEARQGHSAFAHEIRGLVDEGIETATKFIDIRPELGELVIATEPRVRLSQLIVADQLRHRILRILREYRQQTKLRKHGLKPRRKILLAGPPGTGKTMTAAILASELGLPLFTILLDKLVTKFMGETSAKLRQIFDVVRERRGVYLFDEFDAIGTERGRENEVGEMRRVLNSFLQFIENDDSDSLIVSATNNAHVLDSALFRRFDDVLYYRLPNQNEIGMLIKNRLGGFMGSDINLADAVSASENLSHAEITQACDDAMKEAVLADAVAVTASLLQLMLGERRSVYDHRDAEG